MGTVVEQHVGVGSSSRDPASYEWWADPLYDPARTPGLEMPDWAASAGFTDPSSFAEWYRGTDETLRPDIVASMQSAATAKQEQQQAQQSALDTIVGQQDWIMDQYGRWVANPDRANVLQRYEAQSAPGFDAIGDAERGAYQLELQQNAANNLAQMQAAAAGRGVAGGGNFANQVFATNMRRDAASMMLNAAIDKANQEARDRALAGYGGTLGGYGAMDRGWASDLTSLAGAKAGLESGVQYMPTDFTAFGAASQQAEDAAWWRQFLTEQMELQKQQAKFGLDDLIQLALPFVL
jgi:hypothetical protein